MDWNFDIAVGTTASSSTDDS